MPPIRPRPFQIGSHEDKARRPCKSPTALQGLSGIGIPNRKTQARQLANYVPFAVRVGVVDLEASLSVGLGELSPYRNLVGLCELLQTLRFSFLFSSTLAHSSRFEREMILRSMKLDVCTSDDEKGNVFPGCKKGVPRVSGSLHSSLGQSKSAFSIRSDRTECIQRKRNRFS